MYYDIRERLLTTLSLETKRSQHSQECKDPRRDISATRDPKTNNFPLFQDSSWSISMSSSVILAASVFETSCGKKQTDRQTPVKSENITPRMPSAWLTSMVVCYAFVRYAFVCYAFSHCMLCFWSRIYVQQMVEMDDECNIIKNY